MKDFIEDHGLDIILAVMAICTIVIFLIIDTAKEGTGGTYTSTDHVEMVVVNKNEDTTTSVIMAGKVPVVQTHHHYYLIFEDGSCKVDPATYNNTNEGDSLSCYKVTYKNKADDSIVKVVYKQNV